MTTAGLRLVLQNCSQHLRLRYLFLQLLFQTLHQVLCQNGFPNQKCSDSVHCYLLKFLETHFHSLLRKRYFQQLHLLPQKKNPKNCQCSRWSHRLNLPYGSLLVNQLLSQQRASLNFQYFLLQARLSGGRPTSAQEPSPASSVYSFFSSNIPLFWIIQNFAVIFSGNIITKTESMMQVICSRIFSLFTFISGMMLFHVQSVFKGEKSFRKFSLIRTDLAVQKITSFSFCKKAF